MKCFLMGGLGAILVLTGVALLVPMYSDYSDRAITGEMLFYIKPIQDKVENQLINNEPVSIDLNGYELTPKISKVVISSLGAITVQGGKSGQIFILTPKLTSKKIIWQCMGGHYHAMPPKCKKT